jgi:hypothetical protein
MKSELVLLLGSLIAPSIKAVKIPHDLTTGDIDFISALVISRTLYNVFLSPLKVTISLRKVQAYSDLSSTSPGGNNFSPTNLKIFDTMLIYPHQNPIFSIQRM